MSDTPWEDKFEALPPWAKKMVRAQAGLEQAEATSRPRSAPARATNGSRAFAG